MSVIQYVIFWLIRRRNEQLPAFHWPGRPTLFKTGDSRTSVNRPITNYDRATSRSDPRRVRSHGRTTLCRRLGQGPLDHVVYIKETDSEGSAALWRNRQFERPTVLPFVKRIRRLVLLEIYTMTVIWAVRIVAMYYNVGHCWRHYLGAVWYSMSLALSLIFDPLRPLILCVNRGRHFKYKSNRFILNISIYFKYFKYLWINLE